MGFIFSAKITFWHFLELAKHGHTILPWNLVLWSLNLVSYNAKMKRSYLCTQPLFLQVDDNIIQFNLLWSKIWMRNSNLFIFMLWPSPGISSSLSWPWCLNQKKEWSLDLYHDAQKDLYTLIVTLCPE